MSAHGFKSVFMVGGIAAAALGCYLVSLRVASERAELEIGREQDRPGAARHPLAQHRDRHARPPGAARALERQGHPPLGALGRPVRRKLVPARHAGQARRQARDRGADRLCLGARPGAARSGRDQRRRQHAAPVRASRPAGRHDARRRLCEARAQGRAAPLAAKPTARTIAAATVPAKPAVAKPKPALRRNPSKPRRLIRSAPCRPRRARPRASPIAPPRARGSTKSATTKESGSRQ